MADLTQRVTALEELVAGALSALVGLTARPPKRPTKLRAALEGTERQMLKDALASTRGNVSAASRRLGVKRGTLITRMKVLGVWSERSKYRSRNDDGC